MQCRASAPCTGFQVASQTRLIAVLCLLSVGAVEAAGGLEQPEASAAAPSGQVDAAAAAAAPSSSAAAGSSGGSGGDQKLSPEEQQFFSALNEDLNRFNSFFIDKEEDAVIKLQVRCMGDALA